MRVIIKNLASFREAVGRKEEILEVEKGLTVADLVEMLLRKYPRLGLAKTEMIGAVNHVGTQEDTGLREGDMAAVFPPVSSG